mgnify:CR=1 FL=1
MDFQRLFSLSRLFDTRPSSSFKYSDLLLYWFSMSSLAWIIFMFIINRLLGSKQQNLNRLFCFKLARYYLISNLTGLFFLLARVQNIPLFGMRFFLLVTILIQIGMALYFVFEKHKKFPAYQKKYLKELERQKYLPKKRKKK